MSAPAACSPVREPSRNASANTPTGASRSTQCTITSSASAIAWKKPTSRARASGSIRVTAKPKATAKTTSGSIAPSAAACTGFTGTMPCHHAAAAVAVGTSPALTLRNAAAEPASTGHADRISGNRSAASAAEAVSSAIISPSARAASPPVPTVSEAEAMPVITSAKTSGTIPIRSALSHSPPTGSAMPCATGSSAPPVSRSTAPQASPPSSARSIFRVLLIAAAARALREG